MDGILEYLEKHNYTSMSMYTPYNSNQRLFVFSKVNYYNSIDLNWLYDKYVISYKNQTYNIKIKQIGNYTMRQTLNFGNAIFNKLMYDANELKNKKQLTMTIIKKLFVINDVHNSHPMISSYTGVTSVILIYRPSLMELNMEINKRKQTYANRTCCVCYEFKYIDGPLFNCRHEDLCYDCSIHCSVCPLCRSA